jgi:hypothetical protein
MMVHCTRIIRQFYFPIVFFLCLPAFVCFGQQDAATGFSKSVGLGLTGGRSFLIDNTISSVAFAGFYKGIAVSAIMNKGHKQEHTFYMSVWNAQYANASFYTSEIQQTSTLLTYVYLHDWVVAAAIPAFSLKAGADIAATYNNRTYTGYINRENSFEYFASVGVVIKTTFAFNKYPKGITISNKLGVKPFAFLVQPAYERETISGSIQENRGASSFFKSGIVVGPAGLLQLNNELLLQKPLSKTSTIGIKYLWSFWRINGYRELKQAVHLLELGCLLKFN